MKKSKKAQPDRRAPMTRDEALATLAEIVRTPVGEIDEAHPLAQEVRRDEVGGDKPVVAHVVVKMPDKLAALKTMGAWCGWETGSEADKKQADALANLTAFVRSRRRVLARTAGEPLPAHEKPAEPEMPAEVPAPAQAAAPAPRISAERIASVRRSRATVGST